MKRFSFLFKTSFFVFILTIKSFYLFSLTKDDLSLLEKEHYRNFMLYDKKGFLKGFWEIQFLPKTSKKEDQEKEEKYIKAYKVLKKLSKKRKNWQKKFIDSFKDHNLMSLKESYLNIFEKDVFLKDTKIFMSPNISLFLTFKTKDDFLYLPLKTNTNKLNHTYWPFLHFSWENKTWKKEKEKTPKENDLVITFVCEKEINDILLKKKKEQESKLLEDSSSVIYVPYERSFDEESEEESDEEIIITDIPPYIKKE